MNKETIHISYACDVMWFISLGLEVSGLAVKCGKMKIPSKDLNLLPDQSFCVHTSWYITTSYSSTWSCDKYWQTLGPLNMCMYK